MPKPRCFDCGKQLMYKDGKPIFTEYIDPIGNVHQLHKDCFKYEGYSNKPVTAQISDEVTK